MRAIACRNGGAWVVDTDIVQEVIEETTTAQEAETISATAMATRAAPQPPYHLRIEPSRGWVSLKLRELWEYRELLYFLTWRDVKVRYKQTVLGAVTVDEF